MNPSSLFTLSLIPLSTEETLEICSSGQFPSCDGVWKKKAEVELGIPAKFFDLYLERQATWQIRPLTEFDRYLELVSTDSFIPQMAVSRNRRTEQIYGLIESFAGVCQAIVKGNLEQFDFFFSRMKPETLTSFRTILNSGDDIEGLFFLGPNFVSYPVMNALFQQLEGRSFDDVSQPLTPLQKWFIGNQDAAPTHIRFRRQRAISRGYADDYLLENWAYFSAFALERLVERGNERALDLLLSYFDEGQFEVSISMIFSAVLRSGRLNFLEKFRSYLPYVFSQIEIEGKYPADLEEEEFAQLTPKIISYYYGAAANSSNPEMMDALLQLGGEQSVFSAEVKKLIDPYVYLNSVLDGFSVSRNLLGTYALVEKLKSLDARNAVMTTKFSMIPLDILDLIYHMTSFDERYFSESDFFVNVLALNLGYLDVVKYCLEGFRRLIEGDLHPSLYFLLTDQRSVLNSKLKEYETLAPLSVSVVRSTIASWNLNSRYSLTTEPEEIEF